MSQAFQVAITTPIYQGVKPERDPKRLAFIRSLPCIVCGGWRFIEAAHFGPRGLSQKTSDADTLPVCRFDHRISKTSYHRLGPVRFAAVHHLDTAALLEGHQQLWKERSNR